MYEMPTYKYASPVSLAKAVTAAFVLYACADLYGIWWFVSERDLFAAMAEAASEGYYDPTIEYARAAMISKAEQLEGAMVGFQVFVIIAWCMWTYRVAHNTRCWDMPMATSPGWAVGYYFIPIVNLWKPYTALAETWIVSDPELARSEDPIALRWARRAPWIFLAWWLTWRGGWIFERVALGMADAEPLVSATSVQHLGLTILVVDLIAVALAVTVCWKLTRHQEQRASLGVPRAAVVTDAAAPAPAAESPSDK